MVGVSRVLLGALERAGFRGRTVLELGCGVGGLTIEMVARGAARATGVDLSPRSIEQAARLAEEAGLAGRCSFLVGDGAAMELERHDVVVLGKVICCYPDADALLARSLAAAGSVYGFVVPVSTGLWGLATRAVVLAENAFFRVRRSRFRAYVHDVPRIEARVREAGFTPLAAARRLWWHWAVYVRRERPEMAMGAVGEAAELEASLT